MNVVIMGVQERVRLLAQRLAEEIGVELDDIGISVRFSVRQVTVDLVKRLDTFLAHGVCGADRVAAG